MKIREALDALKAARAEYHEKAAGMTMARVAEESAKIKKLNQAVQDIITDGANDCPDCVNRNKAMTDEEREAATPEALSCRPMGLFHEGTPNPFEVGCPRCPNHRVREALPEDAVEKWNKGEYLPPREPGTAVATIKDATGKVKEQKTVKVRKVGA
jgi:hypothetical protein